MVHEYLKGRRGIAKAKEHDSGFKQSHGGDEGCFPLVFFLDVNVIVPPTYVKFSEYCEVFHVIYEFGD